MADPCARAASQYAAGDIDRALKNIGRCQKDLESKLRKYQNQPSIISQIQQQLARAYRFEGQIYFSQNNTGKAHQAFTQALKAVNNAGQDKEMIGLKGQIQYSLGIIGLMRQQNEVGINLLKTAQESYFDADMGEQGLEVLLRLGAIYRDMGEIDTAIDYFEQVQKLRKKANDKKNRRIYNGRAKLEQAKLDHQLQRGNPEKLLKNARKEFRKAKFDKGVAQVLLTLADIHENRPDLVREYLMEANELGQISETPEIQGVVLTKLGVLSLKSGDFEKGKNQLLEGLKYRSEAGDKLGMAQTLVELARITLITARQDDDLDKGLTFANQALGLYQEESHAYGQATTLELLGTINTKLGNLKVAKQQIQEGRSIYADYDDVVAEGRMLTQMGLIYGQEERPEKAITVLEKAIELFDAANNPQGKAETLHILAMQYRESDPDQAIVLLKQSKSLYQQLIGDNQDMQIILKSIDQVIESLS